MSDSRREEGTAAYAPEQFGYQQQFERTIRRFTAFAIGFAFISILTGTFTTYGSVLNTSGPVGIWTWPLVILGQTMVALVFGALASRIPLAGYSYQWMSRLANPYIGWLLGWFVFAFLVVDVVAVDYALASTVLPALLGYSASAATAWLATAIIIALQGLLIMFWLSRSLGEAGGSFLQSLQALPGGSSCPTPTLTPPTSPSPKGCTSSSYLSPEGW